VLIQFFSLVIGDTMQWWSTRTPGHSGDRIFHLYPKASSKDTYAVSRKSDLLRTIYVMGRPTRERGVDGACLSCWARGG